MAVIATSRRPCCGMGAESVSPDHAKGPVMAQGNQNRRRITVDLGIARLYRALKFAAVDRGMSSVEIADQFTLTVNTVKLHMKNIRGKLHMKNRNQAAAYATQVGVLQTDISQPHRGEVR
jgi:hypothetical protein